MSHLHRLWRGASCWISISTPPPVNCHNIIRLPRPLCSLLVYLLPPSASFIIYLIVRAPGERKLCIKKKKTKKKPKKHKHRNVSGPRPKCSKSNEMKLHLSRWSDTGESATEIRVKITLQILQTYIDEFILSWMVIFVGKCIIFI